MSHQLQDLLSEWQEEFEFSHFGITDLGPPQSFQHYQKWLDANFHGEMSYLKEHAPAKEHPVTKYPLMKSALVFAFPYFPAPHPHPALPKSRIALYARNQDYHFWLKESLRKIAEKLKQYFPELDYIPATDSSPILERDLGARSGIGWFGKNTCLIHPKKGSLFLLGEILTNLPFAADKRIAPLPDFCGTCRRCVDICPTNALVSERNLDATKCISYWTIESRQVPPEGLRAKFGDWLFGCDLCQTVCPWNEKIFKGALSSEKISYRDESDTNALVAELRWLLTTSGKQLQKSLPLSPLQRAGPFGLRRNAMIVAANLRLNELSSEIKMYENDERLGELARWALKAINQAPTSS